ncbi:hypothetical protein CBR_g29888 [Chara braunii]|uniref:Methyltransferase n=1 Tax=Chara braunii TaxID=69332 RepID=A0A388JWW3_CHABU|nr:hypothetical protein CBR_g29888 [Chara braunii]|eukprot:GBG62280.1 hypothetical protein CBR_g29888 [Chara braunii]
MCHVARDRRREEDEDERKVEKNCVPVSPVARDGRREEEEGGGSRTGGKVASWGGDLLHRGVLPLSFAPKDNHEAQIQFALERGIPAMLGVIATQRLPYPSRAFDMAHCSRCLIPWSANGGLYLTEIARILRPGGFWVLSGPPVNYQQRWRGWETTEEEQRQDLEKLRDTMKSLCFTLYKLEGDFAIWQKPTTNECHNQKKQDGSQPAICDTEAYPADDAWYVPLHTYVPMEPCVTPFPDNYVSTPLRQWSERLNAIPPRILESKDESAAAFQHDVKKWQERVEFYKTVVGELGSNKIRNVMDMNAGYGSFAAALIDMPVWTMNVVSTYGMNTLGAVFDRGLIGTYHDWCEAFSTYPRTYDMLHAAGLFSAEGHRCELTDVMLEMDRILRPNGVVIVRDLDYVVERVANAAKLMRWNCQSFSDDHRSVASEEVLVCRKEFWTI